jgi:hypothetical protein
VFEKLYREALELVGAYGKLIAVLRKCIECVDDSRKGRAPFGFKRAAS